MNRTILAVAMTLATCTSAFAWGAVSTAWDDKLGWSEGKVVGYDTEKEAAAAALNRCQDAYDNSMSKADNAKLSSECTVDSTFQNGCVAVAGGSNGIGWGVWDTAAQAEQEAMKQCGKYSKDCHLAGKTFCDGDAS
jgi:hypothetical protein